MKILIINNSKIPAVKYGGTERVIWGLGKALHQLGHEISYLVAKDSYCSFAKNIYEYNDKEDLNKQIPADIDVVHLNFQPTTILQKPYITTFHGNVNNVFIFDKNTIFISANQAKRFHGEVYVHNGLDWDEYEKPDFNLQKEYFHFLGDAAWKVKNVKGAIAITKKAKEKLIVLGGHRLNLNMGIRLTLDTHVCFKGQVNDKGKSKYLKRSKGLIFPVLWHEPFGLAIIESLYFGCPVFGTTFGSLPELVNKEVGFLSNSISALAKSLGSVSYFNPKHCHEYALSFFNAKTMALNYIKLYEMVMNNQSIHAANPYFPKEEIISVKKFSMDI